MSSLVIILPICSYIERKGCTEDSLVYTILAVSMLLKWQQCCMLHTLDGLQLHVPQYVAYRFVAILSTKYCEISIIPFLCYWNGHNTVCYILLMVCNYTLESMRHTDLLLYYQQSIVKSEIIPFLHYWNCHNTVCCILEMVCNYTFQSRQHTDLLLYYQQGTVK